MAHNHKPGYDRVHLTSETLRKLEDSYGEAARQFQEVTRQFHEKRSPLLRILNSERASTRNLPPETMSLIFAQAHDNATKDKRLDLTLTLGQVSSHWRHIVWSTPQLWTGMIVNMQARSMNSIVQLLRLYLQNVRGLPFSLVMAFFDPSLMEESLRPLLELVSDNDNSGKIRCLTLAPPLRPFIIRLSNGTFPNLESLQIIDPYPNIHPDFSLINLPHLSKLCLLKMVPKEIELSWPILTSLDLTAIPIDICMKLLVHCPNLVDAHIREPTPSTTNASGLPWVDSTDKITLRHLERLSWSHHPNPICLSVFQRISAPSLQELHWRSIYDETVPNYLPPEFANFPSMSSLQKLSFTYVEEGPVPMFRKVFAQTKHLQVLAFDDCDYYTIEGALSALAPAMGSETPTSYLPLLNELNIEYRHEEAIGLHPEEQDAIFSLLERQWRSGIRLFRMDLFEGINWEPEVRQGILSLIEEGFELESSEDWEILSGVSTDESEAESSG